MSDAGDPAARGIGDPAEVPPPRPASWSVIRTARIMQHHDANLLGDVHGGVILHMIDDTAGAVANRHIGGRAVTAALDEMSFLAPVHVGDLVSCVARVNRVGASSCEIGVRVEAQRWNEGGTGSRHVASAYVLFVGIDDEGRPRRIPGLLLESADDERHWREAEIRHQARVSRRRAITASRET
jgi:acyl-CoA hydrolase